MPKSVRVTPHSGRRTKAVPALATLAETPVAAAPARTRSSPPEADLRRWYETSPAMLHLLDASGVLLMVSDQWLRTFGYRREEVLGRRITDFLVPESRDYSERVVLPAFLQAGQVEDAPFRAASKDGKVFDVLISAVLERSAEGNECILGSLRDITDQKHAERTLLGERLRLANILAATNAATWEWNVVTGEVRFNRRCAEMVGRSLHELEGSDPRKLRDSIHPDDRARYRKQKNLHFAGKLDRCECELRVRHRDGRWIWVYDCGSIVSWTVDGKPEWMVGTRLDITERKLQEEALRQSMDFLDRTGALAGVGGWQVDLVTGRVEWSTETRRILGVDAAYQPTLEKGIDFYAPEARPIIRAAVDTAAAGGGGWDLELPVIRADGRRIYVRVVGSVSFEQGRAARLSGAFQDVTEARSLARHAAEQHELLRVTLHSIGDAVITTDAAGRITWLNPVAERLTGWSGDEALGKPSPEVFTIIDAQTREACTCPVVRCLDAGSSEGRKGESQLISRTGEEFGIEESASPIRNAQGEILGAVLVFRDVSEQRRLSSEIQYRASHDALTGLPNRTEFEARLNRLLQRANEGARDSALLFIDLDQFKIVNDSQGHGAGDRLLQQVVRMFSDLLRANDSLARLGGDEFGILVDTCSLTQAGVVAQRLCEMMENYRFVEGGQRFRVGASIGLVPINAHWSSTAELLQAADACCVAAKEEGGNRFHVWSAKDQKMAARTGQLRWAARIERALDEGRFSLFAQRYTSLQTDERALRGEVLIRMLGEDGELIQPGAFLPAADRYHLSSRIDKWVLAEVLRWMEAEPDLEFLSCLNVNVSGQALSDRAFHKWALSRLSQSNSSIRRRLCLEITETAAVTNLTAAGQFCDQLRSLDVRVALDDFGAGASWFGYLKKMRVDYLKIDGQFTRDLLKSDLNQVTIRCFTEVAKTLGIMTVAECVEDHATMKSLRELGVSYAQGYLIHRPAPLSEFRATGLVTGGTHHGFPVRSARTTGRTARFAAAVNTVQ